MIVHFPAMHSGLIDGPAPEAALFFDPGLADEAAEGAYRPQGLPLGPKIARRIVEDSLRYGEEFKNPGEMVVQALFQDMEDKEHSWTIRSELEQRLKADAGIAAAPHARRVEDRTGKESEEAALAQAQFLLLLAATGQERSLELRELSQGVSKAWESFGKGLGLHDDEDADKSVESISRTLSDTGGLDDSKQQLPWALLLGAMAAWLPAGTLLAASDAEVAAAWADLDLEFAAAAPEMGLPSGWGTARAPAWKLAGKRRAPAGPGWGVELVAAMPIS